jgi:hypothetical protein
LIVSRDTGELGIAGHRRVAVATKESGRGKGLKALPDVRGARLNHTHTCWVSRETGRAGLGTNAPVAMPASSRVDIRSDAVEEIFLDAEADFAAEHVTPRDVVGD